MGGSHIVFLFQCSFHDYDFNYDLDHDLDFGCDYDCDFDLIGSIEWEGVWFVSEGVSLPRNLVLGGSVRERILRSFSLNDTSSQSSSRVTNYNH